MVPNLCTRILELSKPSDARGKSCIGYFKGPDASKYVVYNAPSTNSPFSGATSLSKLIADRQRLGRLPKPGKWKLAGSLSMATLLYHSTPWLNTTWKSDDVLFFNFSDVDQSNTLDSPYLHPLSQKKVHHRVSNKESSAQWIKNVFIYRLGIMLLELEFEDTLANLVQKSKVEGSAPADMLIADPLLLLKHRAGEHLGTLYGRIVRMCLDCDFGLGLNDYPLEDANVQKVFYSRIVRQFQERMPEYSKIWEDS